MAIKDSHGVVVAYYGRYETLEPRTHRVDSNCQWGPVAMKSNFWELFRNRELTEAFQIKPCPNCFPDARR